MEGKGGLKELFFGFMDMLSKWMALSGLLLLGCIPVVTAGASWAAAYYTAVMSYRDSSGNSQASTARNTTASSTTRPK